MRHSACSLPSNSRKQLSERARNIRRIAHSFIGSAPLLAWKGGTLVFLGIALGVVLAIYAVYWMIFKCGKD